MNSRVYRPVAALNCRRDARSTRDARLTIDPTVRPATVHGPKLSVCPPTVDALVSVRTAADSHATTCDTPSHADLVTVRFYPFDPKTYVMAPMQHVSRRTALKLTGAAASAAVLAGCSSADDGEGGAGDGSDDGDATGGEQYEIDPGTEIIFYGDQGGWEGKAPADIEGVENPTLVLQAGETYTIGWDEGDGGTHNIELRDSGGSVVGDYETGFTNDSEPDDQFIEFEATDEIAVYRCDPHAQMEGDIVVE